MANAILGTKNRASAATYSGGSWSSTLPITNLATTDVTQVARTSSAALADTRFRMDLGANYTLRCFGLINHSLSTAGTWRVRAGTAGLDVDYTSGAQSDDRIAITGGVGGMHVGPAGVLIANGSAAPRLVYNYATLAAEGVLLEGPKTNLILRSEDLSHAAWITGIGASITANNAVAPDGNTTMDLLTVTLAGGYGTQQSVTITAGSTLTVSAYAKPGASNFLRMQFAGTINNWFDISTGALGTSSGTHANVTLVSRSIELAPNGSYRMAVTVTTTTITSIQLNFLCAATSGATALVGNSANIWGVQIEEGGLTSYIPTAGSTVTRTADAVTAISGATFTALHSATAGTLYAEFVLVNATGTHPILSLDDNTANEQLRLYTSGTDPKFTVTDGGATQADLDAGTVAAATTYKMAASWAANDFAACLNGGTVATDTSGTLPTVDRLRIGADQAGNGAAMYLKRVTWWATALTDAQLQSITTTSPDALGYNSGWVDADRLTWYEDVPTAWGGIYPLVEPFTTAISARYITFEASDTTNAAGYLDFGRPFVGDALQATYNISYCMADGLEDLSGRAVSPAGKVYGTSRRPRRNVTAQLDWLSQPEADRIHEVMLNARTLGELLWVPDPADAALVQRYGMLCTLKELPQVGYPMQAIRNWQFALEEIL